MRHTEYESVTALDVDAVPALDAAHPEAWLALDAASDVFGASNVGKPVLVNGGVLVLRNTAWARELVRAWWRNRCGPADQYALWKSLAELWRRDHPKFRFSDGVFANYASARERFLPEVARRVADGALPARGCAADATCAALFRASGCLAAPLALPHLYVTPVAGPFRVADGSAVRPLQKGDHAWMCHFDSVYETLKEDVHFAALEAAVGARDAARVPALVARVLGSDGGDRFDASCARPGDALRPALYRFNGVEPDRGRACALALNESLQSQYAYAPAANVLYEGPRVLVKSKCGTAKRYLQPEEARRKCELKAARKARLKAKLRRDAETAARHEEVRIAKFGRRFKLPEKKTSTVRERAEYYRHEHRWRAKNNMSYCAAVDAAADAIASKTTRAAWVVVCTPPRCAADQAEVAALTSRASIPVVALTTLGGASTEMSGSGRSKKLRIVREYLMNEGKDLDVVVFSDATDVLANAGTLREVERHLEGDQLLVAGDPSCWIGAVCDEVEAANLRRALPGHFENRGLFANSGQYVGSRTAVLRFVDWAVGQLDAKEVTRELANLLSPSRVAEMKAGRFEPSDQCLLHAYWASYPERVRIDSNAAVFASFKRFYVLEADDRGVRTPGRAADGHCGRDYREQVLCDVKLVKP